MKRKKILLFRGLFIPLIGSCLFVIFYGFSYSTNTRSHVSAELESSVQMKPIAARINEIKNSGKLFAEKDLFSINESPQTSSMLEGYLKSFTPLKLNGISRNRLLSSRDENISFNIPTGGGSIMTLELTRVNITTEDFKAGTFIGNGSVNYVNYTRDRPGPCERHAGKRHSR